MTDLSCGGLFSSLVHFDKSRLKATQTAIKTVDGRHLVESTGHNGRKTTTLVSKGILGYVGDIKEDLQVVEAAPGLLMGSQDVAHNLELLKEFEVTHILNVATGIENLFPEHFTYKNIELFDLPGTNILRCFPEAFTFIDGARSKGKVFVHCNAGVSRSATIVLAYLMKTTKVSFKDAFKRLREMRPAVCPNAGFMAQLEFYDETLKAN